MTSFKTILADHARAIRWALAAWLALGIITALTWLYDEAGQSFGMHPFLFLLHLAAPGVAGALIGWHGGRAQTSTLAGLACAAANFAGLLVWSAALIAAGRVQPGPETMPAWEGVGEAAGMGFVYLVWGTAWGWLGWLIARLPRWMRGWPAR